MAVVDLLELVERAERGDAPATAALLEDASVAQARATGGDLGFRVAVLALEHILTHPAAYDDETARERYSALCDEHAAEPTRLARLRPLGERLQALEREGVLPRAMVVRARRRRD